MDYNEYEYLESENEEENEEEIEENSNQIATTVLEDNKIQDDLDLIALVEGNPKLYAKGKIGYKNVQEKEMTWMSIGKALKHPLSGPDAKQRWDTLRNLYSRARRQISTLTEQQGRSGSRRDNVSYENLLTPQSMAIHRFMSHLYIPRKTFSNYTKFTCPSSASGKSFLPRPLSKSSMRKHPRLHISDSEESITLNSPGSSVCKENVPANSFKISENKFNKSIGGDEISDCSLTVPKSDIKKRKKINVDNIDSVIKESSQTIAAACSALPTFLNATSKADTEEDKYFMSFLLHGLKCVPEQQKIRCVIKMLEVLESFQQY
ncbi:uncharacterized protein LOC105250568 [Camponotus floridanus]|uniref:uncharacterized protein LOC105250568 n=1 Tax=Camponotus floridanus TaxID=104421 RepID=UPI000DC66A5B|nr:uncharacterized protein LOC105250568 [Camponotus floridanus]